MSHFLRCNLEKRGWKAPSSAWEEGRILRGTRRRNLSEASPLRRLQSSRRGRLFPRSCAAASLRAESPSFPVLANEREGTALSISLGYFRRESPSFLRDPRRMGSNAAAQRTQQSVDHDAGMAVAERHERAPLRSIHRSPYFPWHRFFAEAVAGTKQTNIQLVDKQTCSADKSVFAFDKIALS